MTFETIDGGIGLPKQPDWQLLFNAADECASAESYWSRIVTSMRGADTVSEANGAAIKRLVIAGILYDRASAAVMRDGAIRRVKGVDRKNPSWMVMRQAAEMCSQLEGELGLSPAKRSRVGKVARSPRKRTAADAYLKPVR
jgi:P27 family predicted phage terminase small subunit